MITSPYAAPLPYGGWVLSLSVLLGGFFWLRSLYDNPDDMAKAGNRGGGKEGEDGEEGQEPAGNSGQNTTSSAYQTDEEAEKARLAERRRADRRRGYDSHSIIADRVSAARRTGLLGDQAGGEPSFGSETAGTVFTAAAMAASAAVRKSHFDHLGPADRLRVEREAYTMVVHEYIQRELGRYGVEFHADRDSRPGWGR